MTGRTFNFRSPVGIVLTVLAGILLLIIAFVALDGLGFSFDPFDLSAKRLARAEQQRDQAQQDATARRIEAAGTVETLRRVEQVTIQIRAAEQIAFQSATAAAEAPDANTPVDPSRLDRLRLADDRLCQLRPAICAEPATTTDPATGHRTVPPAAPS
ncbi:hypothetical protein [Brevundimonas sp.]|uniref:hypothetical protein n=1 Tax=Brevundimonas sp. TaxID=1871086 RepID=UPI002898AA44|nr:hypothetical protein [Brevundimonas sp.]